MLPWEAHASVGFEAGLSGGFSRHGPGVAGEADCSFSADYCFPHCSGPPRSTRLDRAIQRSPWCTRSRAASSSGGYGIFGVDVGAGVDFANVEINPASDAAFDVFEDFGPDAARGLRLDVRIRDAAP